MPSVAVRLFATEHTSALSNSDAVEQRRGDEARYDFFWLSCSVRSSNSSPFAPEKSQQLQELVKTQLRRRKA